MLAALEAHADADGEKVSETVGDALKEPPRDDGEAIDTVAHWLTLPESLGETVAVGDTLGALDLDEDLLASDDTLLLATPAALRDDDGEVLGGREVDGLKHALEVPHTDGVGASVDEDEPPRDSDGDALEELQCDAKDDA